jgi:hypothetical protein
VGVRQDVTLLAVGLMLPLLLLVLMPGRTR